MRTGGEERCQRGADRLREQGRTAQAQQWTGRGARAATPRRKEMALDTEI